MIQFTANAQDIEKEVEAVLSALEEGIRQMR